MTPVALQLDKCEPYLRCAFVEFRKGVTNNDNLPRSPVRIRKKTAFFQVEVEPISYDSIKLTWSPPTAFDVFFYHVHVRECAHFSLFSHIIFMYRSESTKLFNKSTVETTILIDRLVADKDYDFLVLAYPKSSSTRGKTLPKEAR